MNLKALWEESAFKDAMRMMSLRLNGHPKWQPILDHLRRKLSYQEVNEITAIIRLSSSYGYDGRMIKYKLN